MKQGAIFLIVLMCAGAGVAQVGAEVEDPCAPLTLSLWVTGPDAICAGETAEITLWVLASGSIEGEATVQSGCPICFRRPSITNEFGAVGYVYDVAPEVSTFYDMRFDFEYCGLSYSYDVQHFISVNQCGTATLGQGFWGNADRESFLGHSGLSLLSSALAPEMAVGSPNRSLHFGTSSAPCVIQRLPAGGRPAVLPPNPVSNDVLPPVCQPISPLAVDRNGRFQNSLLGQTVALATSSRIGRLSTWRVCRSMWADLALPGPDGTFGSADDIADEIGPDLIPYSGDETRFSELPQSVIEALTALELKPTADGLLELANRALGGQPTGGAKLQDINTALEKFNALFEHGAILRVCSP